MAKAITELGSNASSAEALTDWDHLFFAPALLPPPLFHVVSAAAAAASSGSLCHS